MLIKKYLIMDFADWLKTYRSAKEISLRVLAERIDFLCSDAYLSQLENRRYIGKKGKPMRPDIEIVEALANALDRPIDEARAAAGYKSQNNPTLPPQIRINDFDGFDDDDLKDIAEYIAFKKSQKEKAK